VIAPVDWLPEVPTAPDHAPEAEQVVAFVEDQVSIEAPPLATDVGLAPTETATRLLVDTALLVQPQTANARARTRTIGKAFARNIRISASGRHCDANSMASKT
jgi:hypothetical protein